MRKFTLLSVFFFVLSATLLMQFDVFAITKRKRCNKTQATIYVVYDKTVKNKVIIGGPDNGKIYEWVLRWTAQDDVIKGTNWADTIYGYWGNDMICGIRGDDLIYGGEWDDRVRAWKGADKIYWWQGNDVLRGARNNDTIYGGKWNDLLYGHWGDDLLYGEQWNDMLCGNKNNDMLYGGAGDDEYDWWGNTDTINDYEWVNSCARIENGEMCAHEVSVKAKCELEEIEVEDEDELEEDVEEALLETTLTANATLEVFSSAWEAVAPQLLSFRSVPEYVEGDGVETNLRVAVHWSSISIGSIGEFDLGNISVVQEDTYLEAKLSEERGEYFWVKDLKWSDSWYYTTIQSTMLRNTTNSWASIPAENIRLKVDSTEIMTLAWKINFRVVLWESIGQEYVHLASPRVLLRRPAWTNLWKIWTYAIAPWLQLMVPAYQPPWEYSWKISFTLFEQ